MRGSMRQEPDARHFEWWENVTRNGEKVAAVAASSSRRRVRFRGLSAAWNEGEWSMKEYSNDEIKVYWDPKKCIHSAECVKCLPGVFDPDKSPWINIEGASTEEITKAIDRCPSGALSYERRGEAQKRIGEEVAAQIRAMKDGPLLIKGDCVLIDEDGTVLAKKGPFALCRCGRSKNKPYCDGSHKKAD